MSRNSLIVAGALLALAAGSAVLPAAAADRAPLRSVAYRFSEGSALAQTNSAVSAWCHPGERLTGGGFDLFNPTGLQVFRSAPTSATVNGVTTEGWGVGIASTAADSRPVGAYAMCASS